MAMLDDHERIDYYGNHRLGGLDTNMVLLDRLLPAQHKHIKTVGKYVTSTLSLGGAASCING